MEFDVKEVKETRKGKKYRARGRESQKRVRKSPGPTALTFPPKVELTQWTQWTQWTQLTQSDAGDAADAGDAVDALD